MRTLTEADWVPLQEAHRTRAETWTLPHLARRGAGVEHPVEDFLFDYYSFEPGKLARWHPGIGVLLEGEAARPYLGLATYRAYGHAVGADPDRLAQRRAGITWIRDLLGLTAGRPARLDCLGLHEWAMVHRSDPTDVRHVDWPLRLGASGTDEVVEAHQIKCTHFDAFRFFTPSSRPLNTLQPTRQTQAALEQPGCLHANMDLYKWAYKLSPYGDCGLLLDAFELARDIRELDMRASPYDLGDLGYEPVRIERPDGKAEYVRAQREFAERASVIRQRLIDDCDRLLSS